ncbi:MAG: methylated-DNA--[protein]-cysteine S-methyltransferase [Clostridia bacterium]|jgi:methylated-DNA-[protein]-cysteine S-methyltransferase|nr:methylated-DNA--[protein]-cysteine S-methyltransferase [Clostridia bacterium]MDH7571964.1 methylated-DNA--[protein]-cysteine S-methyltransferase [Clostridia bacterium]
MRYLTVRTAWGWIALAGSEKGLAALVLPRGEEEAALAALRNRIRASSWEVDPKGFGDLPGRLEAYFTGERVDFADSASLDWGCVTGFRRQVLSAVRLIPYGQTRSYGWLAEQSGRPRAWRAVGQALKANPWPVIVPCHRVIGKSGDLGGFSEGRETKARLLILEGARAVRPPKPGA